MSGISKFVNTVSSIFGGTQNPKRVVYMNELNEVVGALAGINQGKPLSFFYNINNDGGSDGTTFSVAAIGSACVCAGCTGKESPACKGCPPANDSSFYTCAASGITFTNSATGVYKITLVPTIDYGDSLVRIGNLSDGTSTISLSKVSKSEYNITIKDSAGNPVAGKLASAAVEVLIFY